MKQNSNEPATKKDLDELRASTKQDFKDLRISTKRDLNELKISTKQDLNDLRISTKHDLDDLRKDFADLKISNKQDIADLRDELTVKIETSGAKFRDDILTRLDDIVIQLRDLREDRDVTVHHTSELRTDVDNHEKRIHKIEKIIHTT